MQVEDHVKLAARGRQLARADDGAVRAVWGHAAEALIDEVQVVRGLLVLAVDFSAGVLRFARGPEEIGQEQIRLAPLADRRRAEVPCAVVPIMPIVASLHVAGSMPLDTASRSPCCLCDSTQTHDAKSRGNNPSARKCFLMSPELTVTHVTGMDRKDVARPAGLEPATPGLEGRCSIRAELRAQQTLV